MRLGGLAASASWRWQHHILPCFSLEPQPAVTGAIYSTCAAGVRFGPDITEAFLRDNGLRCILRGHEGAPALLAWAELVELLSGVTTTMPCSLRGMQQPMCHNTAAVRSAHACSEHAGPDSRVQRPDMAPMSGGWTLDHDTPAGKLYTVCARVCPLDACWMRLLSGTGPGEPVAEAVAVAAVRQAAVPGRLVPSPCPVSTSCLAMSSPQVFSAPCYPQFGESFTNLGAVAVLSPPAFDAPRFVQYEAAPRPQATAFYLQESEDAEAEAAAEPVAAGTAGAEADEPGGSRTEESDSEDGGSAAEAEGRADEAAVGSSDARPGAGQGQFMQPQAPLSPSLEAPEAAAAAVATAAAAGQQDSGGGGVGDDSSGGRRARSR